MYMLHPRGIEQGVIRISDKACIPNCADNSDWMKYQAWLVESEENQPIEFDQELYNQPVEE